ncbi:MAG: hypothetical protein JSV37_09185 [Anaerolineaceae bacterium]|nr:MAG: hypothetical protein JSV37_09185 [Anaerolineaceae bacterium]
MRDTTAKTIRTVAIVFMGLTAAMNLLGGIGTVCAAFLTKNFPPMWAFYDYQLRYQILMIVTIIIGILCVWATMGLVRGGKNAYRNALVLLIVGTVVGGIQFFSSLAIRGKATPANIKFFTNAITLLIFLLIRLPGIRERVDFSQSGGGPTEATSGGLTAIVVGSILLTTPIWVGSSHMFQGNNWVDVLRVPLILGGTVFVFGGLGRLLWSALSVIPQRRRGWISPKESIQTID